MLIEPKEFPENSCNFEGVPYAVPEYSKGRVDAAGRRLVDDQFLNEEAARINRQLALGARLPALCPADQPSDRRSEVLQKRSYLKTTEAALIDQPEVAPESEHAVIPDAGHRRLPRGSRHDGPGPQSCSPA